MKRQKIRFKHFKKLSQMQSQNQLNKLSENKVSRPDDETINPFKIETGVELPSSKKTNPQIQMLIDQIQKMQPKSRISLSYLDMNKYSLNEFSIRSMVSANQNFRGRFTIRTIKDANKNKVMLQIYCIA